jgi:DNA-binding MarR family transcriptional regulator
MNDRHDAAERGDLIAHISDLQRDLARAFAQDRSLPLFASNLTMQQLRVIMLISHRGSASGQDIAGALGVALGTVTGIVDRLVAQGLVTRQEDPRDRRIRRIALTAQGQALSQEIMDAGVAGFTQLLDRLDTETLRCMENVMTKIAIVADELHPHHCHESPTRGQ